MLYKEENIMTRTEKIEQIITKMYSFSDFCLDNEVLSKEATDDLRHLRAMWDVCGDYYIAFCETNELEYEVIV